MTEVTVVVVARAKPGMGDEAEAAFRTVVEATHREEGCLLFALHRVASDPERFALVERWRSREDLDAHLQTPHLLAFRERAPELWAEPMDLMIVDPVTAGDPALGTLAGA